MGTRGRWTIALLVFFVPVAILFWLGFERATREAIEVRFVAPGAQFITAPGAEPIADELVLILDPDDTALTAAAFPIDAHQALRTWNPGFELPADADLPLMNLGLYDDPNGRLFVDVYDSTRDASYVLVGISAPGRPYRARVVRVESTALGFGKREEVPGLWDRIRTGVGRRIIVEPNR